MPSKTENSFDVKAFLHELKVRGNGVEESPAWMFGHLVLYLDVARSPSCSSSQEITEEVQFELATYTARFGGARVSKDLADETITHVVVRRERDRVQELRQLLAR